MHSLRMRVVSMDRNENQPALKDLGYPRPLINKMLDSQIPGE